MSGFEWSGLVLFVSAFVWCSMGMPRSGAMEMINALTVFMERMRVCASDRSQPWWVRGAAWAFSRAWHLLWLLVGLMLIPLLVFAPWVRKLRWLF